MAFALLVMSAIAMGASPVFVRTAEVGPFASAFWRVSLALPFLWMWARLEKPTTLRSVSQGINKPLLLSGLFFAGDLIFWHLSIVNTTVANATLMATLAPVWVVLFSAAWIGEPVQRNNYTGLALCLVGAALLVGSSFRIAPERVWGDVFGLITSLFFGLYFLSMRVARRTHDAGEATFVSTIVTGFVLFAVAILSGNQMLPETLSGVTSLLALGAISHAGGQGLLSIALGSLSAVFSSLVIFIEALAGAFFGWLVFSEALTPLQWGGGVLILAGVWIARPTGQRKR